MCVVSIGWGTRWTREKQTNCVLFICACSGREFENGYGGADHSGRADNRTRRPKRSTSAVSKKFLKFRWSTKTRFSASNAVEYDVLSIPDYVWLIQGPTVFTADYVGKPCVRPTRTPYALFLRQTIAKYYDEHVHRSLTDRNILSLCMLCILPTDAVAAAAVSIWLQLINIYLPANRLDRNP